MDYLQLTADERRIYRQTVTGTHHREVELRLLDRDHKFVSSHPGVITGGGIDWDDDRDPAAVLTLTLVDIEGAFDWKRSEHRRYIARVIDSRFIPGIGTDGEWVDSTVFTGPLWDHSREGVAVTLVAHSCEEQAQGSIRSAMQWAAKTRLVTVARQMLAASGAPASRLVIPSSIRAVLPRRLLVGVFKKRRVDPDGKGPKRRRVRRVRVGSRFVADKGDTYWAEAESVAEAQGRVLYADRRGRYVMQRVPKRTSLNVGPDVLLSPIRERRPGNSSPNRFEVLGRAGKHGRVKSKPALFPRRHPLSGQTLAQGGVPRYIIDTYENDKIGTRRQANRVARARRDRALGLLVEYEIEMLPVCPWLDPHMLIQFTDDHTSVRVRVTRWSFPLGPDASAMTVGFNRREAWHRGRRRK